MIRKEGSVLLRSLVYMVRYISLIKVQLCRSPGLGCKNGRFSSTSELGFPFAKLLRNFLLLLCNIFARKNSTLHNPSQTSFRLKLSYSAFALYCVCNYANRSFETKARNRRVSFFKCICLVLQKSIW